MSPLALLFTFCSIPKESDCTLSDAFSPSFSSVYGGSIENCMNYTKFRLLKVSTEFEFFASEFIVSKILYRCNFVCFWRQNSNMIIFETKRSSLVCLQTGASFGNNQLFCQIKTKWRQNSNSQKKLQNETFCIDFQTL